MFQAARNARETSDDATALGISAGAISTRGLTGNNNGNQIVTSNGIITSTVCTGNISGTQVNDKSDISEMVFDINAGITKMRVYIWVEGQDLDCLNSVAGAALSAALKFTID